MAVHRFGADPEDARRLRAGHWWQRFVANHPDHGVEPVPDAVARFLAGLASFSADAPLDQRWRCIHCGAVHVLKDIYVADAGAVCGNCLTLGWTHLEPAKA